MRAIETLFAQLDEPEHIDATRREIVFLLRQALEARRDSLDKWQTFHFANAIRALALNVNRLVQPTHDWLRLCLADFRLACFPDSERRQAIENNLLEAANGLPDCEQLLAALEEVATKLDTVAALAAQAWTATPAPAAALARQ